MKTCELKKPQKQRASWIPLVLRALMEEEEASEDVREKRRGTSASLAAGSTSAEV